MWSWNVAILLNRVFRAKENFMDHSVYVSELSRGNLMFLKPKGEASKANMLVSRTSNFQGATIITKFQIPRSSSKIISNYFQLFKVKVVQPIVKFHNCLSCVHNCDDQSCLHMFPRSSNIWYFLYHLHNHLDRGSQWLAPSWLDSSDGRAPWRYRRGHGFESR